MAWVGAGTGVLALAASAWAAVLQRRTERVGAPAVDCPAYAAG
ncbi:hypothetical protein ACWIG5_06690 [Streptomyces lydicus]